MKPTQLDYLAKKSPRRRRRQDVSSSPAPVALTLVAAELIFGDPVVLRLAFDRAIDVSGLDPSQFIVQDPTGSGFEYTGQGVADTPAPQTVDLAMVETGSAKGTLDVLTATADTGIVAIDDGATWAGVTDLGLPWP